MNHILKSRLQCLNAAILTVIAFSILPLNPVTAQIPAEDGSTIHVKNVNAISIDRENTKWFSTDAGIVSFNGENWILHDRQQGLPKEDLKSLMHVAGSEGSELWIASPGGATVARLPIDEQTDAHTYTPDNSPLMSPQVLGIAAGKDSIRWIGTDKGVSALLMDRWLAPDYDMYYTERMFSNYPITSMATNPTGDTLFVGTAGIGVARVYRDQLDGISGASVYAQWGPIILPSDNVRSIYVAADGTKWFGTEAGVARHTGNNTLDNWTVYTTEDGLVDNFVQAICEDKNGNIWFGTPAGISVFDGSAWTSYTTDKGLVSNNILSLAADQNGVVWIGTDAGIGSFANNKFETY
jgi:ligand-binding sensor domain-containing protein